jgi:hypothetical protein
MISRGKTKGFLHDDLRLIEPFGHVSFTDFSSIGHVGSRFGQNGGNMTVLVHGGV